MKIFLNSFAGSRSFATVAVFIAAAMSAQAASPSVKDVSTSPHYISFAPFQTSRTVTVTFSYDNFPGTSATAIPSVQASNAGDILSSSQAVIGFVANTPGTGTVTFSVPNSTTLTHCKPYNVQIDMTDNNGNTKGASQGNAFAIVDPVCAAAGPFGPPPTTTTVNGVPNSSLPSQSVAITATVVGTNSAFPETGTVTFFDSSTPANLGTYPLTGVGLTKTATFNIATLSAGSHNIYAAFDGDEHNLGSSGFYTQVVGSPTASIKACKFYDVGSKPVLSGWSMTVDSTTQSTGVDGCTTFNGLDISVSHTVSEDTTVPLYSQTALVVGGSSQPTAASYVASNLTSGSTLEVDFGNVKKIKLSGTKYYDSNENGTLDEAGVVAGIKIVVSDCSDGSCVSSTPRETLYTANDGTWSSSSYVLPGPTTGLNLLTCEVLPTTTVPNTFFVQTGPVPNFTSVSGSSCFFGTYSTNTPNLNFGNVCVAPGLSHDGSKGWWTNGGQSLINGTDIANLISLNLVNNDGSAYDAFTNAASVGNYLTSSNAGGNAAKQLSQQLAGMTLNLDHGYTVGTAVTYVPPVASVAGCGGLSPTLGNFLTLTQLTTAANTILGTNPNTNTTPGALTCEQNLTAALDRVNNNTYLVAASASSCPFTPNY